MSRLATLLLAGMAVVVVAAPSQAADLLFPPEAPALLGGPVELGTGWYLRGDAGWTQDKGPQLSADVLQTGTRHSWVIDIGGGYKFNNWFRTDLTASFNNQMQVNLSGANVTCPYGLTGLSTQTAPSVQVGYLWDTTHDTCTPRENATLRRNDFLLNGYVDLGTWYGFSPYVGAGVGISLLSGTTNLDYYKTSDGSLYAANLTPAAGATYPHIWVDALGNPIAPQPAVSFDKQNWSRVVKQTNYNFAWALMGGIAFDVSDHAKIDVGYRYLNAGTYTSLASPITGAVVKTKLTSQQVKIGFRYMID